MALQEAVRAALKFDTLLALPQQTYSDSQSTHVIYIPLGCRGTCRGVHLGTAHIIAFLGEVGMARQACLHEGGLQRAPGHMLGNSMFAVWVHGTLWDLIEV